MNALETRRNAMMTTVKEKEQFRTLGKEVNSALINCAGNSYLNLESYPEIQQEASRLTDFFYGNGASRLVQEISPLYTQLETELASWKNSERTLLFNSGYVANLSLLQATLSSQATVFSDRLNHASIVDGIRLSGAKLQRYNHGDVHHLEELLQSCTTSEKCVVTDTVFSMDGTVAPLEEIVGLCKKYEALLMVDEAHATGIYGRTGGGLVEELGLEDQIDLRMGTLSKALCGVGGYVACSQQWYDFFVNHCRGLIYSTALPPVAISWDLAAVRYVRSKNYPGQELREKAHLLRTLLCDKGIAIGQSTSHIIPVITGSEIDALSLSEHLLARGFRVPAIRPPTVPVGSSRVRISLHDGITTPQIYSLAEAIILWWRRA